jgi:HlyD family secretion protein
MHEPACGHARRVAPAWALLAALLLTAACGEHDSERPIVLNGRIEAPLVNLAPKVAGRVAEVRVRAGDRVSAGDLLVRLDLGEVAVAVERERRAVASAEARYRDLAVGSRRAEIEAVAAEARERRAAVDLAERELARQQQLRATRVGTERDLDRARTELERARASLASSEQRLALVREGARQWQTTQARAEADRARSVLEQSEIVAREADILAPADGVVLHRLAEPGQLLAAGQPGVTMAFHDRLYVRTFVPETQLGHVRQGMRVEIAVDAFPGRRFPGRITEISPTAEFTPKPVETRAERVNLVYAAQADLDEGWNAPLVPGQPADVIVARPARGSAGSTGSAP